MVEDRQHKFSHREDDCKHVCYDRAQGPKRVALASDRKSTPPKGADRGLTRT